MIMIHFQSLRCPQTRSVHFRQGTSSVPSFYSHVRILISSPRDSCYYLKHQRTSQYLINSRSISSWLSVSAYEGIGLPLFDPIKRYEIEYSLFVRRIANTISLLLQIQGFADTFQKETYCKLIMLRFTPLLVLAVSTFIYRKQQRLDRNALAALIGISLLSSLAGQ